MASCEARIDMQVKFATCIIMRTCSSREDDRGVEKGLRLDGDEAYILSSSRCWSCQRVDGGGVLVDGDFSSGHHPTDRVRRRRRRSSASYGRVRFKGDPQSNTTATATVYTYRT